MDPKTPPRGEALSSKPPAPLQPVSAEDFARQKRRIVFRWLGAVLVAILLAVWIYQISTASVDAEQAFQDGEQLLKATQYGEAIRTFDRALAIDKSMAKAYLLRARAHVALIQMEPAIQDFTKAIELKSSDPGPFLERASVYLAQLNYKAVIADCGEVISRNPKLVQAYTFRGMAYRETGNHQKALEDFNHAIDLSPGLDNYFQRAATYQTLGDHKMAIADLDRAIDFFPTSPMGYLARSKSREALGDIEGARSDREEGRRLEGRYPDQ